MKKPKTQPRPKTVDLSDPGSDAPDRAHAPTYEDGPETCSAGSMGARISLNEKRSFVLSGENDEEFQAFMVGLHDRTADVVREFVAYVRDRHPEQDNNVSRAMMFACTTLMLRTISSVENELVYAKDAPIPAPDRCSVLDSLAQALGESMQYMQFVSRKTGETAPDRDSYQHLIAHMQTSANWMFDASGKTLPWEGRLERLRNDPAATQVDSVVISARDLQAYLDGDGDEDPLMETSASRERERDASPDRPPVDPDTGAVDKKKLN